MSGRFDTVTGPKPQPSGNNNITLYFRHRYSAPKHDKGAIVYEDMNEGIVTSTSGLLREMRGEVRGDQQIYLIWKEFNIVDSYITWLHERKLTRPAIDVKTRPAEWTLFKFPKGRMDQYSPLVRDIHTLLNQWLFGYYMKDGLFVDTVASTLEALLTEDHEPEYDNGESAMNVFLDFMVPSVVSAIWAYSTPDAKIRGFVIDTIVKYASHRQLIHLEGTDIIQGPSHPGTPQMPKKALTMGPVRASPRLSVSGLSSLGSTPSSSSFGASSESYLSLRGSSPFGTANEAGTPIGTPEIQHFSGYPLSFLVILQNAHHGSLLVSQLPEHVRVHYPNQVRVFLPRFSYVLPLGPTMRNFTLYGVEEEPMLHAPRTIVSVIELQGPARDDFFEAVYAEGKGHLVLRSAEWGFARDEELDLEVANANEGDVEMEDAYDSFSEDVSEVKRTCVYHEHADDRDCWLLGDALVHGE